jgi:hypothetical protein
VDPRRTIPAFGASLFDWFRKREPRVAQRDPGVHLVEATAAGKRQPVDREIAVGVDRAQEREAHRIVGEDPRGDLQPTDHQVLLGVDDRAAALFRGEYGAARDIPEAGVLLQGEIDQVFGPGGKHGVFVI